MVASLLKGHFPNNRTLVLQPPNGIICTTSIRSIINSERSSLPLICQHTCGAGANAAAEATKRERTAVLKAMVKGVTVASRVSKSLKSEVRQSYVEIDLDREISRFNQIHLDYRKETCDSRFYFSVLYIRFSVSPPGTFQFKVRYDVSPPDTFRFQFTVRRQSAWQAVRAAKFSLIAFT